jgi:hypothetical protein
VTEFGYLTDVPAAGAPAFRNPFLKVGLEAQAAWEVWAHELAWRNPRVRMFSHFLVRDTLCVEAGVTPCIDWPSGFRFSDGAPKPVRDALAAGLFVHPRPGGERELFGRLGAPHLRRSAVVEYEQDGAWRPVRPDDVRTFAGGGDDGIFALRLRPLPEAGAFRIGSGGS